MEMALADMVLVSKTVIKPSPGVAQQKAVWTTVDVVLRRHV